MNIILSGRIEDRLLDVLDELEYHKLVKVVNKVDDETSFLVVGENSNPQEDVAYVGAMFDHKECQIVTDTMFYNFIKERNPEYFL